MSVPARRVAQRFLVLVALHVRAQLEHVDQPGIDREVERSRLVDWIDRGGFADEFEPGEESHGIPCGRLDPQRAVDDWWRIEGAVVLAWALGLGPAVHDRPSDEADLLADVAGWPEGVPPGLVGNARLRSDADLRAMQTHQFFWHWRFVDHRTNPRTIDFAELGRSSWFGNFGSDEFHLVDGDLSVAGTPISTAAAEVVEGYASAAYERHLAVNWLLAGGRYRATTVDT